MIFDPLSWLLYLPGILIGITVHEYFHALAADRAGDPTPAYAGRLTLNPLAHLDWLGFLLLVFAGFGWARPVPVNPRNFQGNRRLQMALVSLAGPAANLLVAFTGFLVYYLSFPATSAAEYGSGVQMLWALIRINVVLAVFNLIPVPPLDGSKILAAFLPPTAERSFWLLERYGTLILVLLIFSGFIGHFLGPAVRLISLFLEFGAAALAHLVLGLF